MQEYEKIPVYIKYENGRAVCVCHAGRKGCKNKACEKDIVTRDKFRGWKQIWKRNEYGL